MISLTCRRQRETDTGGGKIIINRVRSVFCCVYIPSVIKSEVFSKRVEGCRSAAAQHAKRKIRAFLF